MTKVFVSAGTPADETQQAFRDAVINAVDLAGLEPRIMDSSDWDYKNPLRGVRRVMEECDGAIVIAYARYRFDDGLELRSGGNSQLGAVDFPTAWNQIEAAMAYEKGLPLLVVAQNGLRPDALLEPTGDVRPFYCDLDPAVSRLDGFRGYLRSWKEDIDKQVEVKLDAVKREATELTLMELIAALPWHQLMAFILSALSLLAAAATFGYRIGAGEWPLQ